MPVRGMRGSLRVFHHLRPAYLSRRLGFRRLNCPNPWRRFADTTPLYQANTFLGKALKKIGKDKFDKMIVFLGWENGQRTNNHVERNNRVFRMMQKTRYKRRKPHTITKALELELYARMLEHPLYPDKIRALPIRSQETTILKMAA